MTKGEDFGCGKCGVTVPEDAAIACEGFCNKWFDLHCARLNLDEYDMISKLSNKAQWFCTVCKKNVSDLMKFKLVQNKEDWPSILNVVLAGVQGNSEVTLDLSNRLKEMEVKEIETRLTLANLVNEVSHLRETVDLKVVVDNSIPSSRLGLDHSPVGNDLKAACVELGHTIDPPLPTEKVIASKVGLDISEEVETIEVSNSRPISYESEFPSLERRRPSSNASQWEVVNYKRNRVGLGQSPNSGVRSSTNETHSSNKPERSLAEQESGSRPRHKPMYNQKGSGVTAASKRKNPAIIGKRKTVDGITAAEKNSWIFLSRLGPSVNIESIRTHVSKLCDDKVIQCEELQTRYKTYKSFKVGCPVQYTDKLMDGEVWPEGILVTKFVPQRKSLNHNSNHGGGPGPRPRGAYGPSQNDEKNSH